MNFFFTFALRRSGKLDIPEPDGFHFFTKTY